MSTTLDPTQSEMSGSLGLVVEGALRSCGATGQLRRPKGNYGVVGVILTLLTHKVVVSVF